MMPFNMPAKPNPDWYKTALEQAYQENNGTLPPGSYTGTELGDAIAATKPDPFAKKGLMSMTDRGRRQSRSERLIQVRRLLTGSLSSSTLGGFGKSKRPSIADARRAMKAADAARLEKRQDMGLALAVDQYNKNPNRTTGRALATHYATKTHGILQQGGRDPGTAGPTLGQGVSHNKFINNLPPEVSQALTHSRSTGNWNPDNSGNMFSRILDKVASKETILAVMAGGIASGIAAAGGTAAGSAGTFGTLPGSTGLGGVGSTAGSLGGTSFGTGAGIHTAAPWVAGDVIKAATGVAGKLYTASKNKKANAARPPLMQPNTPVGPSITSVGDAGTTATPPTGITTTPPQAGPAMNKISGSNPHLKMLLG